MLEQKSIVKSTGEVEQFSLDKLKHSLARAGANEELAEQIASSVKEHPEQFTTTDDIHRFAFSKLKKEHLPIADRYNLKRSILALGPSGFPFEKYVASLFKAQGYKVKLNQILKGECVSHEADVLISKGNDTELVEVKFHNHHGLRTNVQVSLYMNSRFEDVKATNRNGELNLTGAWIVTNTSFSDDATTYANCKHIKLLSWDYPGENSLSRQIDKLGLHPLTALSMLEESEMRKLLDGGIVLCSQLLEQPSALRELGINTDRSGLILREAEAISALKPVL
jgi:hypothetical protein